MKLLLDTCVWGGAAATLTAARHPDPMTKIQQDTGETEKMS